MVEGINQPHGQGTPKPIEGQDAHNKNARVSKRDIHKFMTQFTNQLVMTIAQHHKGGATPSTHDTTGGK